MYVDTDRSRSNIASTYPALTAPASTRISPASRIASSLLPAVPGTLICDNVKISLIPHHSSRITHLPRAPSPKFAKHVKFGGQLLAVLSWALVTLSSSTIASYFGLFMKLSTDTCSALGDIVSARGVRS